MPKGYAYTVVELDKDGYEIDHKSHDDGYIKSGDTVDAEFINEPVVIPPGELDIMKMVTGGGDEDQEFTFTVKFTATEDPAEEGGDPVKTPVDARELVAEEGDVEEGLLIDGKKPADDNFDEDGNVVVKVKSGQIVKITGIPADLDYEVIEADQEDYKLESTNKKETGVIPAGGHETAFFQNVPEEPEKPEKDISLTKRVSSTKTRRHL